MILRGAEAVRHFGLCCEDAQLKCSCNRGDVIPMLYLELFDAPLKWGLKGDLVKIKYLS